jgi:hypothetical protein
VIRDVTRCSSAAPGAIVCWYLAWIVPPLDRQRVDSTSLRITISVIDLTLSSI